MNIQDNPKPGNVILVTKKNVAWAVEVTGKSYDEVLDALNEADKKDVVCTIKVPG